MDLSDEAKILISKRIDEGNFRKELLEYIPDECKSLLEFGYGDGTLLLASKYLKHTEKIYGIDIKKSAASQYFDKSWHFDLSIKDNVIEDEFNNSIECIVSSCALEHVYDPWMILSKLRRCLTEEGKIVIEIPNVQCWESLYRIAVGEFPYTSGAHFDCTHIRWYTLHSFIEILEYVGFEPVSVQPLLFGVDLGFLNKVKEIKTVELPPPGVNSDAPKIIIKYPVNIKPLYPYFVAPRFIITAERGTAPFQDRSVCAGGQLEEFRLTNESKKRFIPKIIDDPMHPVIARQLKERLGVEIKPAL
jgi:SAM-dependent methyltransferase